MNFIISNVRGCHVRFISLGLRLLFLGVIRAMYCSAPSLVFQERFRIGSIYLR